MNLQTPPTLDAAVESLRAEVTGSVSLPGETGYELAIPWNAAVPVAPGAVVAVESAQDIAATVRFAAKLGLRVGVQRTGHGAVPLGSDVLLVHTGRLTECVVDPENRTARIGAGLIWQDVIDAAAPHGLAPLAGSSPTVGVAGFLTAPASARWCARTGCRRITFVRSTSSPAVANSFMSPPTNMPNCSGGGYAAARPHWALSQPSRSTYYLSPTSTAVHSISTAQMQARSRTPGWTGGADLPEHSSTSLAFLQLPPLPQVPPPLAGRLTVAVRFASLAEESDAKSLIDRIRSIATPLIDAVGVLPYAALGAVHADPVDPMPTHESTALTNELSHEAVDALLAAAGPPGSGSPPQTVVELRLLGGALAREPEHRSAFCHRDAAFSLFTVGVLAPPPMVDAVVPHARLSDERWRHGRTGMHCPTSRRASTRRRSPAPTTRTPLTG